MTPKQENFGRQLLENNLDITICTADFTTYKILWNSVLSMARTNYMCTYIKNIYLCAPMYSYKYMKMKYNISLWMSNNNKISTLMPKMDTYISKSGGPFMAFPKQ